MSSIKIENSELFRANIRQKINNLLDNEKNSTNLEKGIFNFTLKEAEQRKIVKKWDNKYFVQIYVDRLRSIMINLKGEIIEQIKNPPKGYEIIIMEHFKRKKEDIINKINQTETKIEENASEI
jgi:hypothetical protein